MIPSRSEKETPKFVILGTPPAGATVSAGATMYTQGQTQNGQNGLAEESFVLR